MGIFTFFRKRKEKIYIDIPTAPVKALSQAHDNEIYYERAAYSENKYNLEGLDDIAKTKKVLDAVRSFEKRQGNLLYKYYFLKLFSQVALRDKKYNEQMIMLDKQINRIKKNYADVKKRTELIRRVKDGEYYDYEGLYAKINELFEFSADIRKLLNDVEKNYYLELKIAIYSICKGKTYEELEVLHKAVSETVKEYKSMQEAYDFIYFNSGEQIVGTVKALVRAVASSGISAYANTYTYQYFLTSDDVVVLRFPEWIDLFNKMLYCFRMTNKLDIFADEAFAGKYRELEKRYMIILIYNEMEKKNER